MKSEAAAAAAASPIQLSLLIHFTLPRWNLHCTTGRQRKDVTHTQTRLKGGGIRDNTEERSKKRPRSRRKTRKVLGDQHQTSNKLDQGAFNLIWSLVYQVFVLHAARGKYLSTSDRPKPHSRMFHSGLLNGIKFERCSSHFSVHLKAER